MQQFQLIPKIFTGISFFLMLACIESSSAYWVQKNGLIEFSFSWSSENYNSKIRFELPEKDVLQSYKKIKPVEGSNAEKIKIMEELYVHSVGEKKIRLELERFVMEDLENIKPLAQELIRTSPDKSPRGLVKHTLSFVQSIPYSSTFATRTTSLTPIGVLVENKGDCDSKSSLLVCILTAMNINSRLLEIPGHMMVGVDIPLESNEAYFQSQGDIKYIVAETTIRNLPLGVWDNNHLGKPVKCIEPYKPKPPKIKD